MDPLEVVSNFYGRYLVPYTVGRYIVIVIEGYLENSEDAVDCNWGSLSVNCFVGLTEMP